MATTAFSSILADNPGLEDVLDPTGTITASTSTVFEITNATGGIWDGFIFRFDGANFEYVNGAPSNGTISSVTVFDASANIVATAISPFGDAALADVWSALQSDGPLLLSTLSSRVTTALPARTVSIT